MDCGQKKALRGRWTIAGAFYSQKKDNFLRAIRIFASNNQAKVYIFLSVLLVTFSVHADSSFTDLVCELIYKYWFTFNVRVMLKIYITKIYK